MVSLSPPELYPPNLNIVPGVYVPVRIPQSMQNLAALLFDVLDNNKRCFPLFPFIIALENFVAARTRRHKWQAK